SRSRMNRTTAGTLAAGGRNRASDAATSASAVSAIPIIASSHTGWSSAHGPAATAMIAAAKTSQSRRVVGTKLMRFVFGALAFEIFRRRRTSSWHRHLLEHARHDLIDREALDFKFRPEHQPVPEHRARQSAHVVGRHVVPSVERRTRAAAEQ